MSLNKMLFICFKLENMFLNKILKLKYNIIRQWKKKSMYTFWLDMIS